MKIEVEIKNGNVKIEMGLITAASLKEVLTDPLFLDEENWSERDDWRKMFFDKLDEKLPK